MPTASRPADSTPAFRRTRTHLTAVIATIMVVAALTLGKPVTLPLVLGVFLIVLAWPLQEALERRVPRALALTGTAIAVLTVIAIIAGAFTWSRVRVAERTPEIER